MSGVETSSSPCSARQAGPRETGVQTLRLANAKLRYALVEIAAMQSPPKVFIAGSDALETITPAIEERLREARAHEALSKSMTGSPCQA